MIILPFQCCSFDLRSLSPTLSYILHSMLKFIDREDWSHLSSKICQYYIWSMATGKLDGLCGCDAVLGNYKLNTNKSGILCCWHPNHFANYMSSSMRYSLLQNYLLPRTYHLKQEKEYAAFKLFWHDLKSTAIYHIAAMKKKCIYGFPCCSVTKYKSTV